MEVLKYNSNGMPFYWIIIDPDDLWYLKVVKRLDKNSSGIVAKYPESIKSKVESIRHKLLNK